MTVQLLGMLADGPLRGGTGAPSLTAWSLYPPIAISLVLAGGLYTIGWGRLRLHARRSLLPSWRAWCYTAALLTAWVALLSPIGTLADYFLFAHMIEHMLLIMIVPPLFLLGAPLLVILWALPYRTRRVVGRCIAGGSGLRRVVDTLTLPAVAASIYVGTIAFWHLPPLYDLAEGTSIIHEAEHVCFVGAGVLYWWPIIHPAGGRSRLGGGSSLLYLAAGHLEFLIIGVTLTFLPGPIYGYYASPVTQWHLSARMDQEGGLAVRFTPSTASLRAHGSGACGPDHVGRWGNRLDD